MFERFKFGSYHIEDNELANSKKITSKSGPNLVSVNFLDRSNVKFNLDVSYCGISSRADPLIDFLTRPEKSQGL